jgi:hypothetical protein
MILLVSFSHCHKLLKLYHNNIIILNTKLFNLLLFVLIGCSEMLMANAVSELAAKTPGKEALAMESYAKALRQVRVCSHDSYWLYLGIIVSPDEVGDTLVLVPSAVSAAARRLQTTILKGLFSYLVYAFGGLRSRHPSKIVRVGSFPRGWGAKNHPN